MDVKTIYENGESKLNVTFDGEVIGIHQEDGMHIDQSVFIYFEELHEIYNYIKSKLT